jgi:hypothetical protein
MFSKPTEQPQKENPGDATPGRYVAKGDETPGTTLVKLTSGGKKVPGTAMSSGDDIARV